MSRHHSDAEMIARNMTVSASAVLDRQFNPATYPHRHIAIRDEVRLGGPETLVPRLMAAVEGLAQAGWELVTVARVGDRALIAVLRR